MTENLTHGKLVVVKVGGDVLLDDEQKRGLAANIRQLVDDGARVVVIHGGGPQVTALQQKVGLTPLMIAGRRVTGPEDLRAVVQAICGEVNVGLVSALLAARVRAFGCHGASAGLIRAEKRKPIFVRGMDTTVDYGEVGDVKDVNAGLIRSLVDLGLVPVIATLGADEDGRIFNINADTTAVQIAASLHADFLLLVTAVGGVFRDLADPSSRIPELTPTTAKTLIDTGAVKGGMIPKIEEAISILSRGVGAVAILGAKDKGAFRSAVIGDGQLGTRFVSVDMLPP